MRTRRIEKGWPAVPALLLATALLACSGGGEEPVAEQTPSAQEQAQPAEQTATPTEEPAQQPVQTPPPTPRVVTGPDTSPYGFYTIQLSSWRTRAKAEREAERYRGMGLEAYVQEADIPDMGTWFRVRVGDFPSLREAQEAAAALVNVDVRESWVDNFRETVPPV